MADKNPNSIHPDEGSSAPKPAPKAASAEQMAADALDSAAQAAATISAATGYAKGSNSQSVANGEGPPIPVNRDWGPHPTSSRPADLPDFAVAASQASDGAGLSLLDDVTLHVKIELGRTQMYVEDVLRLNANSIVELDKAAGDPVDIYVNDRHVARGEVLVLNENFCVRVSEIIQQIGPDD